MPNNPDASRASQDLTGDLDHIILAAEQAKAAAADEHEGATRKAVISLFHLASDVQELVLTW